MIDCGNAGTGVRLIMGAAAGFDLTATFTGDASLRGRPMGGCCGRWADGRALAGPRRRAAAPHPAGRGAEAIRYRLPEPSAQVKSAVLLAGLNAPAGPR